MLARWACPEHTPWGTPLYASLEYSLGVEYFLTRLASVKREAFVLRYALGYRVKEIAEVMGVPTGTVKDRLVSARRQLRVMADREHAAAIGSNNSALDGAGQLAG
jgi:RNA polymerase sigma-70 factor (ECF subfamily)